MTGHSTQVLHRNIFAENGFFPPIRLLSAAQCDLTRSHLKYGELPDPLVWEKGRAATDRFLFDLAIDAGLLGLLRPLLAENFVLWGTNILVRKPGDVHPWHSDIESSSPDHRFVSVWIGIDHTSRESGLQLISRSHLFGKTFQEVAHEHGFGRGEVTNETIAEWARQRDPAAEFVQPDLQNGDAIIFDGRLWHGSHNTRAHGSRIALLFQYAAPECPVRMPDLTQLEWPFRYKGTRVPVIIVSGKADSGVHHVVP